jgi:hypothetical protein
LTPPINSAKPTSQNPAYVQIMPTMVS